MCVCKDVWFNSEMFFSVLFIGMLWWRVLYVWALDWDSEEARTDVV